MTNHSSGKDSIDTIVNKSFLILDQIQESYFPLLEKSIFSENSSDPANKSKISKLEFVIQQRIKYVEDNCNHLEGILSKLTANANDKTSADFLTYRLNQLLGEQKRILTSFKGIKHKRVEKERAEREQEELLTRRFTTSGDGEQSKSKFTSKNCVINLDAEGVGGNLKAPKKKSTVLSKKVRTRYLNFSTDFFGLTKGFLKKFGFGFSLIVILGIFCFIVFKTTPRHFE